MCKTEYIKFYNSPIGKLAMVTDGQALTKLLLEKEVHESKLKERVPVESEIGKELYAKAARIFSVTEAWLDAYFAGKKMANPKQMSEGKTGEKYRGNDDALTYTIKVGREEILLRPEGSPFRQMVWDCLCKIPYGETVTYGDIAKEMTKARGKEKMSAQAVGGAVGHNPISIIIPCHRVIGAGGNLVGYGGGMPTKVRLLEQEGLDINKFIIPTKRTKI